MASPSVWLVTGCSSGFGELFIRSVLARGDKAIATGRNVSRLSALKEAGAAVLQLDATAEESVINAKIQEAIGIFGGIDVLVNNAGYVSVGTLEDVPYEEYLAQFNANTFGARNMTRAILPRFRQKRAGSILFNSSYFAWTAMPALSPYCGAKAALSAMVTCLQMEVAPLGIRCLCPELGHFRTPVLSPAGGNLRATTSSKFDEYAEVLTTVMALRASLDGNQPGDPKEAVELMVDLVKGEGCAAGKTVPLRLPIGRDAREAIKLTCEEMLKTIEEWKDVIDSTDFVKN